MGAIELLLLFLVSVTALEKDYSQHTTHKTIVDLEMSAVIDQREIDGKSREAVVLFLPALNFGYDSSVIYPGTQLSDIVELLNSRKANSKLLYIEGHTSNEGSPSYNYRLGLERATAAKEYLVALGINVDRIKIISYGPDFPVSKNITENRRVELVIYEE